MDKTQENYLCIIRRNTQAGPAQDAGRSAGSAGRGPMTRRKQYAARSWAGVAAEEIA